jgi:hypothetical protein
VSGKGSAYLGDLDQIIPWRAVHPTEAPVSGLHLSVYVDKIAREAIENRIDPRSRSKDVLRQNEGGDTGHD